MTDANVPDERDTTVDDTSDVDEELDTTNGERDPLSTDDGLAAIAEQMPAVAEDRALDDATERTGSEPADDHLDLPGLQLDDNGTDPLAELGKPGDEVA